MSMNPEQLTQQLVYLLGRNKLVWPDSPGDPVLGRVVPAPAPASPSGTSTTRRFDLLRGDS